MQMRPPSNQAYSCPMRKDCQRSSRLHIASWIILKSGGSPRNVLTRVKTKTPELKKGVCTKSLPRLWSQLRRQNGEVPAEEDHRTQICSQTNDRKNGIAVHAQDMGHRPDWDAAEVMQTTGRVAYWKRSGYRRPLDMQSGLLADS